MTLRLGATLRWRIKALRRERVVDRVTEVSDDPTLSALVDGALVEERIVSDDGEWVGTPYWAVRWEGVRTKPVAAFLKLATFPEDKLLLEREHICGLPVLLRQRDNLLRVYLRPDGQRVLLNVRWCDAVEEALGMDPAALRYWQHSNYLSQVGVSFQDRIEAVIMPVRVPDLLGSGVGGDTHHAD